MTNDSTSVKIAYRMSSPVSEMKTWYSLSVKSFMRDSSELY